MLRSKRSNDFEKPTPRYKKVNEDYVDTTTGETFDLSIAGMNDERLGYVDVGDTIIKNSATGEILAGWPRSRFKVSDGDVILVLDSRDSIGRKISTINIPELNNLVPKLKTIYNKTKKVLIDESTLNSKDLDLIYEGFDNAEAIFILSESKFNYSSSMYHKYYGLQKLIEGASGREAVGQEIDLTVETVWKCVLDMLVIIDSLLGGIEANSEVSSYGLGKQSMNNQIARIANSVFNSTKLKFVKSILYTDLEDIVFDKLTNGINSRGNVDSDVEAVIDFIIEKEGAVIDRGLVIFDKR